MDLSTNQWLVCLHFIDHQPFLFMNYEKTLKSLINVSQMKLFGFVRLFSHSLGAIQAPPAPMDAVSSPTSPVLLFSSFDDGLFIGDSIHPGCLHRARYHHQRAPLRL